MDAEPMLRILDCGDAAFTVEFGEAIDPALQQRVCVLDAAIAHAQAGGALAGLIETVPTFRSLTVLYDPVRTTRTELLAAITPLIGASGAADAAPVRHWRLPACYDDEFGPDVDEVARTVGCSRDDIVALHTGGEYVVYMLGFLPGFPFMGDVAPALALPRRAAPRVRVPAGSVAIATGLTAIYPWESPGGWHLLARCPVPLFDARRSAPALLQAGDRVRFVPVERAEYERIAEALARGELDPASFAGDRGGWSSSPPPAQRNHDHLRPAARTGHASRVEAAPRRERPVSEAAAPAPHATLAVRAAGAYASIQDAGRVGFRRIGVPWAGVLDAALMRIANRLVGNDDAAPVIEAFDGGQQFAAVDAAVRVAVAGDAELEIVAAGERRAAAAWRSHLLQPGDTLRIARTGAGRIVMVAVAGIDVPACLGSAATYARAALGGVHGRALAGGDEVPAAAAVAGPERVLRAPPSWTGGARTPIRVVLGPQADHFDDDAIAAFLAQPWSVSAAADRMGVRLEGAQPLAHRADKGAEIVSDATVPGSIQVPGAGQPIVLLADAQTAGGYPKIATVVCADLPRLAARRPGETIHFAAVDVAAAERLARECARELDRLLGGIAVLAGDGVDLDALYGSNLVGGVVNALEPDEFSRR